MAGAFTSYAQMSEMITRLQDAVVIIALFAPDEGLCPRAMAVAGAVRPRAPPGQRLGADEARMLDAAQAEFDAK